MKFLIWLLVLATITIAGGSPLSNEHLNAEAHDKGVSVVSVDNDVVLTPGKDGHNFNAKSDSKGESLVQVGGAVKGSAEDRDGQEFNAISKDKGVSQVRVLGGIELKGLDPNATKFDAISENGGVSTVLLGNVQIISGARQGRLLNAIAKEGNAVVKAEDSSIEISQGENPSGKPSVDILIKDKPRNKPGKLDDREALGAAWGAAAVASHNSRPWEELENDEGDDNVVGSQHIIAPESDIFDDENVAIPPLGSEIHDFPHNDGANQGHTPTEHPTLIISGRGKGNINANAKGSGRISVVKVKGSVQA